jgi:hypothetical protein
VHAAICARSGDRLVTLDQLLAHAVGELVVEVVTPVIGVIALAASAIPSGFPRVDDLNAAVQEVANVAGGELGALRRRDGGDLSVERCDRPALPAASRRDCSERLDRRATWSADRC